MLVLYLIGIGVTLGLIMYLYANTIDRRVIRPATSRKGELAGNLWAAVSLDCDFEPTKHAFGPGRSVNISHIKPVDDKHIFL